MINLKDLFGGKNEDPFNFSKKKKPNKERIKEKYESLEEIISVNELYENLLSYNIPNKEYIGKIFQGYPNLYTNLPINILNNLTKKLVPLTLHH